MLQGTVLVVDDEEIIRDVATSIIEEFGFRVLVARDGVEALEVFRQRGDEIIAVLLDLTMPRLDGAETFVELRRIRPEVKIILSSGFDGTESVGRFMGEPSVGFIKKPYRPSELIEAVLAIARA